MVYVYYVSIIVSVSKRQELSQYIATSSSVGVFLYSMRCLLRVNYSVCIKKATTEPIATSSSVGAFYAR